jgi:hypothetical protein
MREKWEKLHEESRFMGCREKSGLKDPDVGKTIQMRLP